LALRECLDTMRDNLQAWPAAIDLAVQWYEPQLPRLHEHPVPRAADLAQLARLARGFASCENFLAELTLDPPEASSDEAGAPHLDEDYLILSTIHSAKGQEWGAVYVLNVVDGCIPSEMATGDAASIEEERRLLYVAMTRAQHHLQLLVPQRFHVTQQAARGDRHLYAGLSRFITPQLATHFDHTCPAGPDRDGRFGQAPDHDAVIDVAAAVRSLWN
jgi:DNA helicase-2/ATP-dependent DNA helicase PcrA